MVWYLLLIVAAALERLAELSRRNLAAGRCSQFVPGVARVAGGPLSHPTFDAVVVEGAALPLVHTAWIPHPVFLVLNAARLRTPIKVENTARSRA